MNRQKLISVLQSRIAKRKRELKDLWMMYNLDKEFTKMNLDFSVFKRDAIELGVIQKQDKAILKQMHTDTNRQESYENDLYRMDNEIHKLRRQLASYKLTGMPYVSGNAN